jgi:hypothetical protein
MIPPHVQIALQKVLSDNPGEKEIGLKAVHALGEPDKTLLLGFLKEDAERHPDRSAPTSALHSLAVQKVPGAAMTLVDTARKIAPDKLSPVVPQNIAEIAQHQSELMKPVRAALEEIAKSEHTKGGKAAAKALETLNKKKS